MKYNKEKVEAAKILFAEILELNQQLPEDRWITISHSGSCDLLQVVFWAEDEEREPSYGNGDRLTVSLRDGKRRDDIFNTFADITAKMQEWKELYCK